MSTDLPNSPVDVAIVGAGAAGLMTAICTARQRPEWTVVALDGARRLGAKILVAGGGRCNVTNRTVTAADYHGGRPHLIRPVLAAFTVDETIGFFREQGVELQEEEHGKLFPDTNRSRSVLDALLRAATEAGVRLLIGQRVAGVAREEAGFRIGTALGELVARRLVLATGGLSLPKTGSDGAGYQLAASLGHSIVPTTPALVPLVLDGDWHRPLAGVSQEVEVCLRAAGRKPVRQRGALLWTHFGVSGPVILDISRHWHRARLEGGDVAVSLNFLPGQDWASAEHGLLELAAGHAKLLLRNALSRWLPARVSEAVLGGAGCGAEIALGGLSREQRRRLLHSLLEWPLAVRTSRGYGQAEVTAGGVPLSEIRAATMASRCCPGLFLAGEMLDVDGRIGGFNFQWAWSSGAAAARGLIEYLSPLNQRPELE